MASDIALEKVMQRAEDLLFRVLLETRQHQPLEALFRDVRGLDVRGGCASLFLGVARNSGGENADSGIGVGRATLVDWMLK